jgi:hypothetical protein
MKLIILGAFLLAACTTTKTPAPEAASEAAVEDTGGVSPKAPGRLAETLQQRMAEDPDAAEPTEGEAAEGEAAEDAQSPAEEAAQTATEIEAAAAEGAPTQPAAPTTGEKVPPPCDGLDGALSRAAAGDTAGLELDAQGRVQVTYEFSKPPARLPDGFEQEMAAMGHGQGWCPPAQLCALAGTEGISRVRTVRRASPKLD